MSRSGSSGCRGLARACAALVVAVLLIGLPSAALAAGAPQLDARAWILIDTRDGAVLASKGANRRLPVASTTKLMTAYLALHQLRPSQTLTAPAYHRSNPAEITLGLQPGERMRVRDLLYGLLLPSASDAAETLADGVAGSVPAFVGQMNDTARQLGLSNTSYANPIGLDDPDNYSSAHDLVTLASTLLRDRLFARIVNTPSETLRSGDHPRTVTSRNTLLGRAPWIDGVKTGHTLDAGYVLVGSGTRNSTTLISAVLGTPSEAARDDDSLRLLDYGFSLYHPLEPVHRGEQLADPKLDYRSDRLPLIAQRPLAVNARQGQRVTTQVTAPHEIKGAHPRGEVLGRVTLLVDGRVADSSPVVAAHSVDAATTLDKAFSTAKNPFLLVGLGAIVILLGTMLAVRGRGSGEPETAPPDETTAGDRRQAPRPRSPEERHRMHEDRIRRRRQRAERKGGQG